MNPSSARHAIVPTCIAREIHERARHAEAHRNRLQVLAAIDVEILAGVEHVEAADPERDREAEQPRLPCLRRHRRPAIRRPAQSPWRARETTASPTCSASRASTRKSTMSATGDRTKHSQLSCAARGDERDRHHDDEDRRFGRRHAAAGNLARRRARIRGVESRVDQAVEAHRGAARRHHADDNPERRAAR